MLCNDTDSVFSFTFALTKCVFLVILAAGSYVALTVLGRPPGVPQIPLVEDEEDTDVEKRKEEELEEGAEVSPSPSPVALPASERCSLENSATLLPDGVKDTSSSPLLLLDKAAAYCLNQLFHKFDYFLAEISLVAAATNSGYCLFRFKI